MTTLTKRMSEDLADYLAELNFKVHYLHSEVHTIERVEILRDLRLGVYDVVVGINLLREGLDLPEVSLVAILDADKEGFLRSDTALIQTIGRAARHLDGTVIMYADRITDSMRRAIDETNRRRSIQEAHNQRPRHRAPLHHQGRLRPHPAWRHEPRWPNPAPSTPSVAIPVPTQPAAPRRAPAPDQGTGKADAGGGQASWNSRKPPSSVTRSWNCAAVCSMTMTPAWERKMLESVARAAMLQSRKRSRDNMTDSQSRLVTTQ